MRFYYDELPESALSKRLSFIADSLCYQNIDFCITELTDITYHLVPSYRRRIQDDVVSDDERELLNEFFNSGIHDFCDYAPLIDEVFDNISMDVNNTKNDIKKVLSAYKNEHKNNFGNRINQIADILAAAKKLCFSAKEFAVIIGFARTEIIKILEKLGDDY